MFYEFILFELKKGLKGTKVYLFLLLIFLFTFMAITYDKFTITLDDVSNVGINSSFAIMGSTGVILSSLGIILIAAIMSEIALRDIKSNFYPLVFTKPLSHLSYFFGRMLGGLILCLIPMSGIFCAYLLGLNMPWIQFDRILDHQLQPYFESFIYLVVPTIVLLGSLFYGIAMLARNKAYVFGLSVLLYIAYFSFGDMFLESDLGNLTLLLDPFGYNGYRFITRYWNVEFKNNANLGFDGMFFWSRLIWSVLGIGFLVFAYKRFGFSIKEEKRPKTGKILDVHKVRVKVELAPVIQKWGFRSRFLQFQSSIKLHLKDIFTSIPFLIILIAGLFNLLGGTLNAKSYLGMYSHPSTFIMLTIIKAKYVQPLYLVIMYYSGELVWKNRDTNFYMVYDAAPYGTLSLLLSKFVSLWVVVLTWLGLGALAAIGSQAIAGHTQFQLGLYVYDLFVTQFIYFSELVVIGIVLQVLLQQRYLGYLAFLLLASINLILLDPLEVDNHLLRFLDVPIGIYSDFFGYKPFSHGHLWYNLYWIFITAAIGCFAVFLWKRGVSRSITTSLRTALSKKNNSIVLATFILSATLIGFYIGKEPQGLQQNHTAALKAQYETKYEKFRDVPQPDIINSDYEVDLFPRSQEFYVNARLQLKNNTEHTIDSLHISTGNFAYGRFLSLAEFEEIYINKTSLILRDSTLGHYIYRLQPPLKPGDSIQMYFKSSYQTPKIPLETAQIRMNSNGSFLNNFNLAPRIGYDINLELEDDNYRKRFGLGKRQLFAKPKNFQGAWIPEFDTDGTWSNTEITISTDADQTAVGTGTLTKSWEEGGRNFFRYSNKEPVSNKLAFASANYSEKHKRHNGVSLSVLHHPNHTYNIMSMLDAMETSLEYYSTYFGPYPLDHLRIVEFPRYASYVSAFPGTIMYSESLGFISDVDPIQKLDFPYYITAHEVAHQWWGGQFIPARTAGSGVLTESLAQYCALMVVKKRFGAEAVIPYLRFEHEQFFLKRGKDKDKEQPLAENIAKDYINYHKGALVFYALQERIGEDRLNQLLATFLKKYLMKEKPPYARTIDLLNLIKQNTHGEDVRYINDLFQNVVEHEIRLTDIKTTALPNAYEVTVEAEGYKYYNIGELNEKQPLNGKVTVALYLENKLLKLFPAQFDQKGSLKMKFISKRRPSHVVIDPYYNFLDSKRDDNTISVE